MEKIIINDLQIAYERQGSGTPLVLIHGYPLDHHIWQDIAPLLDTHFDLILPDLRGFGQSTTIESPYTIDDMAADLAGLLDALGLQKACITGHSMGGYVALAFARQYPQRVLGLALVGSQAPDDIPERREGRYATARQVTEQGVGIVAESMSLKLSADNRIQAFCAALILQQSKLAVTGALKAMATRPDSSPALAGFQFPVVLIHGKADALIPVERAQEIHSALPHAKLVELPTAGHMPMMEFPAETASALKMLIA